MIMAYISKFKLKDELGKTTIANVVDRVAQDNIDNIKVTISEIQTDVKAKYDTLSNRFSYNHLKENLTIK